MSKWFRRFPEKEDARSSNAFRSMPRAIVRESFKRLPDRISLEKLS